MAHEQIPHTVLYTFRSIRKRDGRLQDFTIERIERAVLAALNETGEGGIEVAQEVAHYVADTLERVAQQTEDPAGYIPEVEYIQDCVEEELMRQKLFDTAKAYILFRAKRAAARAEEQKQRLASIAASDLSVILRDGSYARFDIDQIRTFITRCAEGFKYVDIDKMVEELKLNIFDGITISQINEAIVMVAKAHIEDDPEYSFLASRVLINELYKQVLGVNEFDEEFSRRHAEQFKTFITVEVENGHLDPRMLDFDFEVLGKAFDSTRDRLFEYRGIRVLWDRYILKNSKGEFVEVPQYFWMRIAMGIALIESDPTARACEFYALISKMLYVPSSPTLIHSGQIKAQMSSCYLNYVDDDLSHIFKVIGDNAQMSKWSGGIGTDWTAVRATNAMVKSINVTSQGLIPFLKVVDSTTASINRSGKRRGAVAVYLENWHMDFEYFLDLRKNTGDERRRTHDINTVAWVPDLFMKRVEAGGTWTLFSPHDVSDLHDLYGAAFEKKYEEYEAKAETGEIELFKKIEAKDLWRKMITMLFETGHPWITFKDPCNIRSPQDHVGVIHGSNLCTEITLNTSVDETAVCNLGSISLQRHMTADNKIDWELLRITISLGMRMIDNVIDLNYYPTIEGKNANMRHRPVGLGIMGYQDVLFKKRMPFDTEEAVQFSDELMEFVSYHAILTSSELAKEKGAYSSFKGSKWDRGLFPQDTIALLEKERGIPTGISGTGTMDWTPVREHVKKYGMRNSNCMAIAPTATIGNISASLPSVEPIYKNIYVKSNFSGDFTVVNEYLVNDLKELGIWNKSTLNELKQYDGSVQSMSIVPTDLKRSYKEVFEMDTKWIIRHAAVRQKWIDQAQSINIFTKTTSGREISDIYFDAWKSGLKTTYYLRTLGASAIEKATTGEVAAKAETPEIVEMQVAPEPEAPQLFETPTPSTPKLHVYVDTTCESCQ